MHPPKSRIKLDDIEELAICSCCQRAFNDAERAPKLLKCKHYFCLACTRGVLRSVQDVRCAHCRQRTELPLGGADALPTYAAVQALARRLMPEPACVAHALPVMWCATCGARACRACDHAHHAHSLPPPREARANMQRDALFADLQRLALRHRDFLLRVLDATTTLIVRLKCELATPAAFLTPSERALLEIDDNCGSLAEVFALRNKLRVRHTEALLQCRLHNLIRNANVPLDFELMRQALAGLSICESPPSRATEHHDPVLFLANYCMAQLYTRNCFTQRAQLLDGAVDNGAATLELDALPKRVCETARSSPGGTTLTSVSTATMGSPLQRNPTVYPLFYFNLEFNGSPFGRIVIEVRDDVAPRMAQNFSGLTTGELGIGYRGGHVFQCWENKSVITGDFEFNNGRGGYSIFSIFEENYFMPDDTKMVAVRGAVGKRRSQKRHDNQGLVVSQFSIMLREMRGFTAIFANMVEGLELVERLSRTGDSTGKPHIIILIVNCGKLNN